MTGRRGGARGGLQQRALACDRPSRHHGSNWSRGHSCECRWGSKLRFHGGVGLPAGAAQRSGASGWEWTLLENFSWYGPELGGVLLVLTGVGRTTRVSIKCSMWSDHVFRRRKRTFLRTYAISQNNLLETRLGSVYQYRKESDTFPLAVEGGGTRNEKTSKSPSSGLSHYSRSTLITLSQPCTFSHERRPHLQTPPNASIDFDQASSYTMRHTLHTIVRTRAGRGADRGAHRGAHPRAHR